MIERIFVIACECVAAHKSNGTTGAHMAVYSDGQNVKSDIANAIQGIPEWRRDNEAEPLGGGN